MFLNPYKERRTNVKTRVQISIIAAFVAFLLLAPHQGFATSFQDKDLLISFDDATLMLVNTETQTARWSISLDDNLGFVESLIGYYNI